MKFDIYLHYSKPDPVFHRMLSSVLNQAIKLERKVLGAMDLIQERLQQIDERLDQQATRITELVVSLNTNINNLRNEIHDLGQAQQDRLAPYLAALDEDASNFAAIGAPPAAAAAGGAEGSSAPGADGGDEDAGPSVADEQAVGATTD